MLSSKQGLFNRAKSRVVGAEQYLTNPFTSEDLLGAIRTHLTNKINDAESSWQYFRQYRYLWLSMLWCTSAD